MYLSACQSWYGRKVRVETKYTYIKENAMRVISRKMSLLLIAMVYIMPVSLFAASKEIENIKACI